MAKDPESKKPLAIINLNQFQKIEIDEHTVRRRLGEQPINRKRLVAIAGASKWPIADFDINSNHAENALKELFSAMKEAKQACVINNWQEWAYFSFQFRRYYHDRRASTLSLNSTHILQECLKGQ